VRRQGFAASSGERTADACAVAVPVLGRGNELVGALTVLGPITRFTPETRLRYAKLLMSAASRVSAQLEGGDN
jgi:DNA-binding IclR family transcriptional regulator